MRILPGVLAHELMYLSHFHERVRAGLPVMETLWLAEALAHSAEDTIASVLRSRGDTAAAREMCGPGCARPPRTNPPHGLGQHQRGHRSGWSALVRDWATALYAAAHFGDCFLWPMAAAGTSRKARGPVPEFCG